LSLTSARIQKFDHRCPLSLGLSLVLRPAVEQKTCVVCLNQAEGLKRALFWFLNENYNAEPVLGRLIRSQGFCSEHTRLLLRPENHSQLTYVAEVLSQYNLSLSSGALDRLEGRFHLGDLIGGDVLKRIGQRFLPSVPCPFCETLSDYESWTTSDLAHFRDIAEVQEASTYLCIPHSLRLRGLSGVPPSLTAGIRHRIEEARCREPEQALDFLFGRFPRRSIGSRSYPNYRFCETAELAEAWHRGAGCLPCLVPEEARSREASLRGDPSSVCTYHAREAASMGWLMDELAQMTLHNLIGTTADPFCEWCACENAAVDGCLALLAGMPADELEESVVCIRHLPLLLPTLQKHSATILLRGEQSRLAKLADDCREYFRKTDYRFKDEPKGAEQKAWLRAAELLWSVPQPKKVWSKND
jgi:hypothetical protein